MVDEWGLQQWEEEILHRWNDINLFQMTRGINRFKGLAMALSEIDKKYTPIVGLDALVDALLVGPEAFKGTDPIDSYCGMWDTHM
jgi:hypothetical protein